jgi:hypothetical protein
MSVGHEVFVMTGITRVLGPLALAIGAWVLAPAAPAANQSKQAAAVTVTFTKDVLPLLQRSCQTCHRPGTAAPMSLLTYEDVRPWARAIKARVVSRQMPPWHLDRSIGTYLDDPSLSDEDIATIARWVDTGTPRGNAGDAPSPLDLAKLNTWSHGEPDLIVEVQQGFDIPAEGADIYPTQLVDPGLTEDRYIKWVQILTDAPCCLHHSHVYAVLPDDANRQGLGLGVGSNRATEVDLTEFVMGNEGDAYPDGVGKKLPKGSMFRFEAHYHPWGEAKHDRQKVGIKFYPKGVAPELVVSSHRLRTGGGNEWELNRTRVEDMLLRAGYPLDLDEARPPVGNVLDVDDTDNVALLSIPPHTVARHERFYPLPTPAMVISFQPHMHFRGSRMLLEAIHPDGRREVLTDVTHFQQAWQINYRYKVPHLFPAGTILHVVSWHDNTAANRSNPDPSAWVGWGARTMDEMGQGWTDIAWLTEAQYQQEVSRRKGEAATTNPGP